MAKVFNPYIAGSPIRKESDFFGRKDILEKVARELTNPGTNSAVLFGQRRIGKTSLLLQLENRLPKDDFLGVYFDLQDRATSSLGDVLADLASTITRKANMPTLDMKFDDAGKSFVEFFLPELYEFLGNRRPVILFDEFDVLDQIDEMELSQTAAAIGLFPFLRNLMSVDTKLAYVFVIGRRVDDLHLNTISLFKASVAIDVWLLDPESARRLILKAEDFGTLKFDESAIEKVISLTNGHPYLSQLICQRVWNNLFSSENVNYPVFVNQEMIDSVILEALTAGDVGVSWIWNGLGPAEKIYAAALAELSKDGLEISEEEIAEILAANAMRLRTREIEIAPKDLIKRRILEPSKEGKYKFAIELFRIWVEKNHSIRDVKDEMDRVEPEADGLYQLGSQSLKKRKYLDAMEYFQKALDKNNDHFQARVELGEILLEQGEIESAVRTLRFAYSLDAKEAKFPYLRALLSQAREREKQGYLQGVIESCEAILKINSSEETALEMGLRSKKLLDFTQRMDGVIEQADRIVKKRIPSLVTILSASLAKQIVNYAVKPALHDWRNKKMRTLNDAKTRIKNLISEWFASDDAKAVIGTLVTPWLRGLSQDILILTREVYEDFSIYTEGVKLAPDSEVSIGQDNILDNLQINFDKTVGIIVGGTVWAIISGFAVAIAFTPPLLGIGSTIVLIVMGLISGLGIGAVVGGGAQAGLERWASDSDIPGPFRKTLLSVGKINMILYTSEDKIRAALEQHLSENLTSDVETKISGGIKDFLLSQKEKMIGILK